MNRIFLDIEANQDGKEHYILQLAAIKVDKNFNVIGTFNEYCRSTKSIKTEILDLLDKKESFFQNIKIPEKNVLLDFVAFSKNCSLFVYGDYDRVILDSAFKRYNINKKLKLINFQKKYINKHFPSNFHLSLKRLSELLNIQANNQHDALNDAILLKRIIEMLYKRIISEETFINLLSNEFYRPIWKQISNSDQIITVANYNLCWISINKKKDHKNDEVVRIASLLIMKNNSISNYEYIIKDNVSINIKKILTNLGINNEYIFIFNKGHNLHNFLNDYFIDKSGYYYSFTNEQFNEKGIRITADKINLFYNKNNKDFSLSIFGDIDE